MFFVCLFRLPAGRAATKLPWMQSEKQLRRNTFCVDPESGADSHGKHSGSSRWQWCRSHFVQTNNTAVYLSSSQRAPRPGSCSRDVTPNQPKQQTLAPPPTEGSALRHSPILPTDSEGGQTSGSYFQGNCWSMQLRLHFKKGNKCASVIDFWRGVLCRQ